MKSGYCACDYGDHAGPWECDRWRETAFFLYKVTRVEGCGGPVMAAPKALSNEEIDFLIAALETRRHKELKD